MLCLSLALPIEFRYSNSYRLDETPSDKTVGFYRVFFISFQFSCLDYFSSVANVLATIFACCLYFFWYSCSCCWHPCGWRRLCCCWHGAHTFFWNPSIPTVPSIITVAASLLLLTHFLFLVPVLWLAYLHSCQCWPPCSCWLSPLLLASLLLQVF